MGTKALDGPTHQFLLKNQNFPPPSKTGECQPATIEGANPHLNEDDGLILPGKARLVQIVSSFVDEDIFSAFENEHWQSRVLNAYD